MNYNTDTALTEASDTHKFEEVGDVILGCLKHCTWPVCYLCSDSKGLEGRAVCANVQKHKYRHKHEQLQGHTTAEEAAAKKALAKKKKAVALSRFMSVYIFTLIVTNIIDDVWERVSMVFADSSFKDGTS